MNPIIPKVLPTDHISLGNLVWENIPLTARFFESTGFQAYNKLTKIDKMIYLSSLGCIK
jgi:hypothetical protein